MLRLGWAAGKVFAQEGKRATVVIGKDTRISGYLFESALEAGLLAAGANVRLLGPMPTPAVAYLAQSLRADAGIVISASHNPHHDNGIKFFSREGEKLDDATESAIEDWLEQSVACVPSDALGKASRVNDALTRYAEYCKRSVPAEFSLQGRKIVLDCAHGATYLAAPKVFTELGAQLEVIGNQPNGLNINDGVGSTHPQQLARAVVERGAELGIAFDGDGDRILMVSADGRVHDGDALIHLLAFDWAHSGRLQGPVVGTLMSNFALERDLQAQGIPFIRSKVGDRHVHRALSETGGVLGGEASGHLLCLDRASTGDAIIAALQVLEVLVRRNMTLADALSAYQPLPQQTRNIRIRPGRLPLEADVVKAARAQAELDLQGKGRLVLRASGTEPLIRVTVEAADESLMQSVLGRLADAVQSVV